MLPRKFPVNNLSLKKLDNKLSHHQAANVNNCEPKALISSLPFYIQAIDYLMFYFQL